MELLNVYNKTTVLDCVINMFLLVLSYKKGAKGIELLRGWKGVRVMVGYLITIFLSKCLIKEVFVFWNII